MTKSDFDHAIREIEKGMEGDAYRIEVLLNDGSIMSGPWRPETDTMITLCGEKVDRFVSLASIAAISWVVS